MGGGASFAEVTPEMIENTDIGHISAIACGDSFTRYSICLKWKSIDVDKSPACFRTNEAALKLSLLSLKETKKMAWATIPIVNSDVPKPSQGRQFGYLSYADEEPKDWEKQNDQRNGFSNTSNSTSQHEGNFRRAALTMTINCPQEDQVKKYVNDSLDYLGGFKPPFIDQGLENCLLSERKIGTDGTTYAYNRSRFICLPVDNEVQAKRELTDYLETLTLHTDFHDNITGQLERKSKSFWITFSKDKLGYSDICQTQLTVKPISSEEIDNFYMETDFDREFSDKKAALLYVFREMDCVRTDVDKN